jgi:hypothetical protein
MTTDTISAPINGINQQSRRDYLAEQLHLLDSNESEDRVVSGLQDQIESQTSLRLGDEDRIALRSYLRRVTSQYRSGEMDQRSAQMDLNKVLMAAAANNPDVLNYIHMDA